MKNTRKKNKKKVRSKTADHIAKLADEGKDISKYFTGKGKMMPAIQRVNVDFTMIMLNELDNTAATLNVSRQAVIKLLLRHALDQHYLATKAKKAE
ncbi:hypothetical protein ACFLRA_01610 [Bdellovibrionota bacterium]